MRLRKMGICRGDGKIFIKYAVSGCKDASQIEMQNVTDDGSPLPCHLYTSESTCNETLVAVIPNIPINQNLSFTERDTQKNESHTSQRISFNHAKWESRLNYKLNKKLTEEIRNYDISARDSQILVGFSEVIPTENSKKVRVRLEGPNCKRANISVRCSTPDKKWVDTKIVWMGEQTLHPQTRLTPEINELRFSIDAPDDDSYIIFEVKDEKNPQVKGFGVLEPKLSVWLKSKWIEEHETAMTDPYYDKWFDAIRAKGPILERQASTDLPAEPFFSIIVPLYKTPIQLFTEMVNSVRLQSYQKWELILANASPDDAALNLAISECIKDDARIKSFNLKENLGISLNTQEGIKHASGDYICFFDHDDTLEPNVLFEYAKAISDNPNTKLIYCDEDKIMPNGKFGMPYFKPDFSIDLLRNNNYICHFLCIDHNLLNELEPSPSDVDGAQDHDLILKATEKTNEICHIPQILYHWRMHEGSTAASADSKSYASKAGVTAVKRHLERIGLDAQVKPNSNIPFTYDVEYHVSGEPLVSIIIPTKDESNVLDACITSILHKSTYSNYEIVIVENNSTEQETFEYYKAIQAKDDRIKVRQWESEFNFSKIINFGANNSDGDYLVLLNNDTEIITPNWIELMLGYCQREDVGIVGARLWYPDNMIQHAGVALVLGGAAHVNAGLPKGNSGYFGLVEKTQNFSAVTAACMMTAKSTFDSVNGFDETFAVAFNDVDYCLKIRSEGKSVVYLPSVELYHYESLSRGTEVNSKKQARFVRETAMLRYKWAEYYVDGDPFYNKNLFDDSACYQLDAEWLKEKK